ncbi:hypothetical protein F8154_10205 [Alkaliphilus pronyensis]|uniref:Uncharacterized protein n=1 Tax=Alkaliphilus pronyensis TaxID=1482732 RepID=A0A6I0F3Z4_9FIRM|nr:hypothetical protein [Alkaliphilus pronyensis]KAB3534042.1 hypothetical protein F8154_10205 [Alkaliphilus pronyensis]
MKQEDFKEEQINTSVVHNYIPIMLLLLTLGRRDEGLSSSINTLRRQEMKLALNTLCSNLNEKELKPIYTLSGALEILDIIDRIRNKTYRIDNSYISNGGVTNGDTHEKQLAFIRGLKEYANDKDRNLLEVIEGTLTTMQKLKKINSLEDKANSAFNQNTNDSKIKTDEDINISDEVATEHEEYVDFGTLEDADIGENEVDEKTAIHECNYEDEYYNMKF